MSNRLEELWEACSEFIEEHRISCAEATIEDAVYINAPHLVERIGNIVGYYKYPEDEEDTD